MKLIIKLILILVVLSGNIYSKEIIATVAARNFVSDGSSLYFDLFLQKNTENWTAFANTTLQLDFLDSTAIDSTDLIFAYVDGTTDIKNLATTSGNQLPTDGYLIEPKVFKGRFSLTIVGPEEYDECLQFSMNEERKLGQFVISSKSGQALPLYLKWKQPYDWYQALAYKTNKDSLLNGSIPFYYVNDNIEMDDGKQFTFQLNIDQNPEERFSFDDFWVFYTGQMIDSLGWSTKLEKDVNGYFVKRGVRTSIFEVEYTDLIGTWVAGDPKFNPGFISKGYSKTGHLYNPFFDTVEYRGGQYCYSLWANMNRKDGTSFDTLLAQECIEVPNAVISKANPLTNPFYYSTIINLHLDDDCFVDGFVVDEIGRLVTTLEYKGKPMKRLEMKKSKPAVKYEGDDNPDTDEERGGYHIPFTASSIASQGLYNVVFIAYPIEDKNIEISKAVVKLQLVKDGNK